MRRLAVALACVTLVTGAGAAPASAAVPAKKFTAKQVRQHSTPSSCWSVINGKVYDLTAWISQHPGGASRITAMCGRDATAAFTGRHGGDPRANGILAGFKIGTLR